jgi:hypothetical protein
MIFNLAILFLLVIIYVDLVKRIKKHGHDYKD